MRDFSSLDHKVECAKCGKKLPSYDLEKGFCRPCRKAQEQKEQENRLLGKQMEKKYQEYMKLLEQMEKEYKLLLGRMEEEDELLREKVKGTNDSLKSIPCPLCGRLSISCWAHYVREPQITSYSDYCRWAHVVRERGITSYIAETYVCSYWRCKAEGKSLSAMQQYIGPLVRMLNKIFPLK